MLRLSTILFLFVLSGSPTLYAQTPATTDSPQPQQEPQTPSEDMPEALPVMCEYRNIKLGMSREQAKAAMGKTKRAGHDWDEFELGSSDLMIVRYDENDAVKTIQLYFTDPSHAPKWTEVVGNAELHEHPNGSKYSRAVDKEENFWVTMFQSKTGAVTTVTISRQKIRRCHG